MLAVVVGGFEGFRGSCSSSVRFSLFSVVEIDSVRATRGISYLGGLVADGWYRWVLVARCPSRLGAQFRCGCRKSARKPGRRDCPLHCQCSKFRHQGRSARALDRALVGASILTRKALRIINKNTNIVFVCCHLVAVANLHFADQRREEKLRNRLGREEERVTKEADKQLFDHQSFHHGTSTRHLTRSRVTDTEP